MSDSFLYGLGDGRRAHVVFSSRAAGDLGVDSPPSELRQHRAAIVDRPWLALRQVHGAAVVGGDDIDPASPLPEADAIFTTRNDVAVSVQVADCAPVALLADRGVAVVHAGWRGIEAGIIGSAAAALQAAAGPLSGAVLGPCIHADCYEFGADDLERLQGRFGPTAVGQTVDGHPALNVPALVRQQLAELGIEQLDGVDRCTGCAADDHWSHRRRADRERQAVVAWIAP